MRSALSAANEDRDAAQAALRDAQAALVGSRSTDEELRRELRLAEEDAAAQRTALEQARAQAGEESARHSAEREGLQRQLVVRAMMAPKAGDAASRAATLAAHLEDKEKQMEELASERTSHKLRADHLERELANSRADVAALQFPGASSSSASDAVINMGPDLGADLALSGMRLRPLSMLVSPEPRKARARRPQSSHLAMMERGLDRVDGATTTFAHVLRRSPGARLMFILYVVMLQVLVFFVLFSPSAGAPLEEDGERVAGPPADAE